MNKLNSVNTSSESLNVIKMESAVAKHRKSFLICFCFIIAYRYIPHEFEEKKCQLPHVVIEAGPQIQAGVKVHVYQ